MKINYIIATYEGVGKRNHLFPETNKVLRDHLDKIFQLDNNLNQITVMKSKCDEKIIENYYNNIECFVKEEKIKLLECENYGYSMGQWLKAYELDKTFDYYLFMEDDYCPNVNNFDSVFVDIYKKKFPDNIGILCSLVQGNKNYKTSNSYPIHFEGSVFVSNETLQKLYDDPKWENNPRKWLDIIDGKIDDGFNWNHQKNSYIGGYYQLTFSHLFTLSGIKHEDYLNEFVHDKKMNSFLYWGDNTGIRVYLKGDILARNFSEEDIINSLIIPIQLSKVEYIIQNTNLNIIKEKYPHRICLDIVENFKHMLKNKIICDIGCGAGDMLEYIRLNKHAEKVIGVEISERICKERKYIIKGDILKMKIPKADIYYFWLGRDFPYNEIISQFKNDTIIIYGDGSRENHKRFQEMNNLICEDIIEFDFDERKFHKNPEDYEEEIKNKKFINPSFVSKGKRIFGIYKKNINFNL